MSLNIDECIETLMRGEFLPESTVKMLCDRAKQLLIEEPNVLRLSTPISVIGDIHGQLYDLFELFNIGGMPPNVNYLFLGDYVDRGAFGVETISLLVCLKLRHPDRIHLLRGNHESRQISQFYGFYMEVTRKYGDVSVWQSFTSLFDYLTVAAIIDGQIFCVHGGLSPSVHTIDRIRQLLRYQELPLEGPLSDLLWSDPSTKEGFAPNSRGAGHFFGANVVEAFCRVNRISHILRAHQICTDGFQVMFDDMLSTVWSAPNYCYRCGNYASILEIEPGLKRNYNVYAAQPAEERAHPPI
ncbi:Ser/Thr protein phosphatase [Carpediemonas membranifera]|uniref:Serine/threonine-protein phosphatase n=1 Tax=Carpediemonas membranifera TaxID=201153 RepID=A0A8J6AXY0_9EUKA|nr:Ser/Thr protein phosphatase [Carpediemonas membranifera]|eukprot:KAG9391143.1 Ser/Thr protein phosphatase [Carpediemonas membranifera]